MIPSSTRTISSIILLLAFAPVQAGLGETREPLPRIRLAPDGSGFVAGTSGGYVPYGVNYFRPGTGWAPQVWKQFDAEATRRDFMRLRELGANCVRVFLTYGSFYETPGQLSPSGLAKLDQFIDLAESAGLYVHPTGPDHWEGLPEWARTDRYADDKILRALEDFWKLLAARYRGRTAIFAYDLLNEPSVGWNTPAMQERWNRWLEQHYQNATAAAQAWGVDPASWVWGDVPVPDPNTRAGRLLLDFQHCRETVADEWTLCQVKAIKSADPSALVTVGYIQWSIPVQLPEVRHYSGFRPARQAEFLDFLEFHFYPLAQGFYEYGQPEAEDRNLAYVESIAREMARFGKPVVVAEFGWYGGGKLSIDQGRHPAGSEADQARWCRRLMETTRGLAQGWLNWGYYDTPQARDVSQLTGLLTADGSVKEWGREFGRLSQPAKEPAPKPRLSGRPDLNWDAAITDLETAKEFRRRYYEAFRGTGPR